MIKFEDWVEKQNFSERIKDLFNEAVICYKVSTYRASLLLSYLGLLNVLKERILRSPKPPEFVEQEWEGIKGRIQDDDKWEQEVFTQVNKGPTNSHRAFDISEDLRKQIEYWKNRRNDCAHYKSNIITYSHVEAFWAFLESNLTKLAVNGGKDALLQKIKDYFESSYPNAIGNYDKLLAEIDTAVPDKKLAVFFDEIHRMFSELTQNVSYIPDSQGHELTFYERIFINCSEEVKSKLVEYFKMDRLPLLKFLKMHPNRLLFFELDDVLMRSLWNKKLFLNPDKNDWAIYCSLLRNRLIPKEEIPISIERIISEGMTTKPNSKEGQILDENDFFKVLKQQAFDEKKFDNFNWGNRNADIIVFYIENNDIDNEIIENLLNHFSRSHSAHILREALDAMLTKNKSKREKFIAVADAMENIERSSIELDSLKN